nr:MAG TPA: hypothetical protein [Caudoviricetes sp.]
MRTPAEHLYILRIFLNKTFVYLAYTVRVENTAYDYM